MRKITNKTLIFVLLLATVSCSSTKKQTNENSKSREEPPQGGPPITEQVFKQMDANGDGKLSMAEVDGPLKNDFAKIDTNSDGFITKEELNKAPKPSRQGPPNR